MYVIQLFFNKNYYFNIVSKAKTIFYVEITFG